MAINLVKGQTIDLRKNDKGESYDLSSVTIGLGWDVKQQSGGFLGKLFGGGKEEEYDLDAIAFLLDNNGKVANLGRSVNNNGRHINFFEGDIIFFNSLKHPSGNIWLTGDNRTGEGDGDDEQIIVKLDALDPKYDKILFIVSIYQGRQKNQHFGMVDNAFIRAVDSKGHEIARYSLSGNSSYNGMCAMTFAEAYRKDGTWKFRAIGDPHHTDSFVDILEKYK
ncbi:TerD family protein [Mucilaginibacter jinjuensis]|uniref:TerD family protein n=1 Tax=Mucilaginibacter jinjuensis TaxID=1176721 RepID=A0ABY7TA37_9SPHI|nr:TerD family protein [Mucilaginibacter jinjuensis]WCT12067.1 TerD family protein [Mucilaginibacter jinjuensis]